jgi:predicted DNA-binding helix-hairpin-helix protein
MKQICLEARQSRQELAVYKKAQPFAPAGQATQMIIGASRKQITDYHARRRDVREVYAQTRLLLGVYPAVEDSLLPAPDVKPPLLREHRLYQADWLMRQYGFGLRKS